MIEMVALAGLSAIDTNRPLTNHRKAPMEKPLDACVPSLVLIEPLGKDVLRLEAILMPHCGGCRGWDMGRENVVGHLQVVIQNA